MRVDAASDIQYVTLRASRVVTSPRLVLCEKRRWREENSHAACFDALTPFYAQFDDAYVRGEKTRRWPGNEEAGLPIDAENSKLHAAIKQMRECQVARGRRTIF